ncbi:MAG: SUMF1/EgtB/PvdO family nonheme iron enzyme [Deltaproteobacteria bacterium]|nr:SUMF1/EgtB/PvdO family nonheme iron enzyme [Deltaproteobacteria bacterium]
MKNGIATVGLFLGIFFMLAPAFYADAADRATTHATLKTEHVTEATNQTFVSSDGDCGDETPCYSTIREAINAAADGSEILVKQGTYEESISLTSPKTLTVKGGYDSAYSQQTPNTTFIQGISQTTVQAPSGSLKIQMMSIRTQEGAGYNLTLTTTGQGSGQVSVSPSGTTFQPGTVVTLTAEVDLGSVFSGWGGDCSGTELTTQITMNADKSVSAGFGAASTDPLAHQAILGPLAGATIQAFSLDDLSNPIEGPFLANNSVNMQAAGSFDLTLSGIADDEWILVSATGGWDIDADDDGSVDANPTRNQGSLYALAQASHWRQGNLKVNALTDMAWRYSQAWVGQASLTELEKRLNEVAQTLLVKKISGTGDVDYTDLLAFNPADASHKDCLSFDYADLMATGGYASQIHAGASDADVNAALDTVFGSVLSFVLPDDLESEVQVRLAGFGRGKVQSSDGLLVVDSEADVSAQKTLALYERDRETPVTFTATPLTDTQILGWTGCDWVSDDQTQCRVGLSTNRQVQVDFGYKEAVIDPQFVDLSLATVAWSGDTLTVVVDENDTDLLAALANIAEGWYVAGMSDQGPFLLQVTEVLGHQDTTWTLKTIQARLEDVIQQGSGTLKRILTHGDLETGTYNRRMYSASGEILPVRLVPSQDPDDRIFRIQVGDVPDPERELQKISGDLVIEDGDAEIRLHGKVDVTIELDAGVDYGLLRGLEYFKFVPEVGVTPALDVTCTGKIEGEKKKLIYTIPFASIKFMAGPVPVWVSPAVDIWLGVEGSVEAPVSMGVSYTMTARGGVQYTVDENWQPIKGFDRTWDIEEEPEFHDKGRIKGFVSAEPEMMVYSLTGPALAIQPYLEGNVTAGFDPYCAAALDWGLWGGITGKLQWKGNDSIPILGKALGKLDLSFEFYNWDRKILGGVLNACGAEPPALFLSGNDINVTVVSGAGGNLQTIYTLTNKGDQDMPWSISKPAFSPVSVSPSEDGILSPGASTQLTVTVNSPGGLDLGSHTYRLEFNNDFQGAIGQSGLGSEDRNVRVTVVNTPPTWTNSLGQTFVLLPAGTFIMGSPSDEPGRSSYETQHQVTLTKSFYMQTTEVTQGQWETVMGSNPSCFSGCPTCPVEGVSWNDVQDFIDKMNQRGEGTYRLPTEAEWEYAARAGSTTAFYNGGITELQCDYDPNLDAIGWYCYNSHWETHPVGQKAPNAWGLYDMSGNVWEWCQDWFDSYSSSTVTDSTGPPFGPERVCRGGSWDYDASSCRSAQRGSLWPDIRDNSSGFRLVLSSGQ